MKYCCEEIKKAIERGKVKRFLCFYTKYWSDKFDEVLNECPYCHKVFSYVVENVTEEK